MKKVNLKRFSFSILKTFGLLALTLKAQMVHAEYQPNITNGEKYYKLAGCAACHTSYDKSSAVGGGLILETGLGKFYAPNISRSSDYGIGKWKVEDFVNAVKNGKKRDGTNYTPIIFPYTSYSSMNESDIKDIFHYIQTLKPVDKAVADHEISVLASLQIKVWSSEPVWELASSSKIDNFGEYFVKAVGHCHECHSQRASINKEIDKQTGLWKTPQQRLGRSFSQQSLVFDTLDAYFKETSISEYLGYINHYNLSSGSKSDNPVKQSLIDSMKELSPAEHVSVFEYLSDRKIDGSEREQFVQLVKAPSATPIAEPNTLVASSDNSAPGSSRCSVSKPAKISSSVPAASENTGIDFAQLDKVDQIFARACNACHAGSGNNYGFAMTSAKEMYSYFPMTLNIFESIRSGSMPKGMKLTPDEYNLVKEWMQSARKASKERQTGVPNSLKTTPEEDATDQVLAQPEDVQVITLDETYKLLADDLIAIDEFDRKFIRYVDFSKSKFPEFECDEQGNEITPHRYVEAGFNKLINSLSLSPRLAKIETLSTSFGPIFRIDLRDYNWNAEQWRAIFTSEYNYAAQEAKYPRKVWEEVRYPYAVNPSSDPNLELISKYTETAVPLVNGPWFSNKALEAPIYDMLLGLTDIIDDLEDKLNLDVKKEILDGNVVRAAMIGTSGVSDHNRLIERFDLPMGGYYWKSYDFDGSGGDKSLELNPDGPYPEVEEFGFQTFNHAGGEMIFSLPNGLQGFYLSEADGRRLQVGPASIVAFKEYVAGKGVEIQNARSCFECHDNGIIQKSDNLRPVIDNSNFFSRAQKRRLTRMFVPQEELYSYFENDRKIYTGALDRLDVTQTAVSGELESLQVPAYPTKDGWPLRDRREIVTFLADKYFQDFYASDVAQLFGMTEEAFFEESNNVNDPAVFRMLKNWEQRAKDNRRIHRDEVEQNYSKILSAITDFEALGYEAANLTSAAMPSDKTDTAEEDSSEKLLVQVSVDGGSERRVGDYLEFSVETNSACNLQLFYVSEAKQILELSADPRVMGPSILGAKEKRKIPFERSVQLQFDSPGNGETMLAYCSKSKSLSLDDILAYVNGFSQPLSRGLKIVASTTVNESKGNSDFDSVTFNIK